MELGEQIRSNERRHEIAIKIGEIMANYLDDAVPDPSKVPDHMTVKEFKEHIRNNMAKALADIIGGHTLAMVAIIRSTLAIDNEKQMREFVVNYAKDMLHVLMQAKDNEDD